MSMTALMATAHTAVQTEFAQCRDSMCRRNSKYFSLKPYNLNDLEMDNRAKFNNDVKDINDDGRED